MLYSITGRRKDTKRKEMGSAAMCLAIATPNDVADYFNNSYNNLYN